MCFDIETSVDASRGYTSSLHWTASNKSSRSYCSNRHSSVCIGRSLDLCNEIHSYSSNAQAMLGIEKNAWVFSMTTINTYSSYMPLSCAHEKLVKGYEIIIFVNAFVMCFWVYWSGLSNIKSKIVNINCICILNSHNNCKYNLYSMQIPLYTVIVLLFSLIFLFRFWNVHTLMVPCYFVDEADMDRVFKLPSTTFIGEKEKALPLR